ncbi:hypothetical protein [Brevibacillus fortis]|uniref:SbsA Ig-like domain-containing protein n=1 Tax=Brevibacillus fortis TaxID=2126352 RepID=A0A2P7VGS2_9BACL|nr:hypothetical protein [Brevibacillus fortis]PSJ98340.1 hypothetical protein C7R93_06510 [Brevibacillus fortis]
MNKKVALSVLSTAVVASMAASAYAAPQAGVYVGGDVKKFYSTTTLLNLTKEAKAQYAKDLRVGSDNLVFVHINGKGAFFSEIIKDGSAAAFAQPLKKSDFVDLYNVVKPDGTSTETVDAKAKVDGDTPGELKVESVSAANGSQIVIKFNQKVDKATAEDVGNYYQNGAKITTADATPVISEDAKSVTLTFKASQAAKSFTFGVKDVKTEDKKSTVTEFSKTVTFEDTVAPTITKSEFAVTGDLVITFSEPLKAGPAIVRVKGTPVAASVTADGDTKITIPAAALTAAGVTVAGGESAAIYVASVKDLSNNDMAIFNGTVTKVVDNTKPTITSVTQVGQDTLRVVFSEPLGTGDAALVDGEFKFLKGSALNGTASVVTLYAADATGKTYDVKFADAEIYGATPTNTATVTLLLAKDLVKDASGNGIEQFTQTFTFSADKTGPAFVSSKVADDKKSVELTFDEAFKGAAGDVSEAKIVITDANGVRFNAEDATTIGKAGPGNEKVLVVSFTAGGVIPDGVYTIQLQAGAVKDNFDNLSSVASTTVTVGSGSDTTKPVATLDGASTVNKFVVFFGEEVTASALAVANYKLDGAALPAGTTVYFTDTAKNKVAIELPAGSVNFGANPDGSDALLSVSNVADKANNVVNATNLTVKVADNTPAVLQSAQKIGNTLVLTFNEALHATDAADATIAEILTNYDIKVADTSVVAGGGAATATLVAGSNNKVQISFTDITGTGYDATKTVTVTTKASGDLKDANGTAAKADVTVTAN